MRQVSSLVFWHIHSRCTGTAEGVHAETDFWAAGHRLSKLKRRDYYMETVADTHKSEFADIHSVALVCLSGTDSCVTNEK